MRYLILASPFNRWGTWSTEKLNKLVKVTEVSGGARIQTHTLWPIDPDSEASQWPLHLGFPSSDQLTAAKFILLKYNALSLLWLHIAQRITLKLHNHRSSLSMTWFQLFFILSCYILCHIPWVQQNQTTHFLCSCSPLFGMLSPSS